MKGESPWQTLIIFLKGKARDEWLETIGVILLAVASFAAAWSGYQAASWGGEQSTLYSLASSRRSEANQLRTEGNLNALIDVEAFNNYANAYAVGNSDLMRFYERRFSERLAPVMTQWLALDPLSNADAPASPFEMPEYIIPDLELATAYTQEASDLFIEGSFAGDTSKQYVLNTVYLATVLFFAGIATKIKGQIARSVMVGLGIMLLVYGLGHLMDLYLS